MRIYFDNWMFRTEDIRRLSLKESWKDDRVVLSVIFKSRTDGTEVSDVANFVRDFFNRKELVDLYDMLIAEVKKEEEAEAIVYLNNLKGA